MIENIYSVNYTKDNFYFGTTYEINSENVIEDQDSLPPFLDMNHNGIPDIIEVIYDGGGV